MTSKLAALAKILLLPRRSAPAFVRPLQRIFGTTVTTDEIRTEPQENDDDDDDEEQLEEQQQQNKSILLEALMARSGGNLNSNYNTKYHKGEQVQVVGPITDPIAKHQLREVRNDYYRSAINNNSSSNNNNENNSNFNFNFNTQHQDDQDTTPASASSSWSSVSSPTSSSQDVVVSRTTPPDLSTIPVGDEYLYLAQ